MNEQKDTIHQEIFTFEAPQGVTEYHAVLHIATATLPWDEQLAALLAAYRRLVEELSPATPVFHRFFLSDAANQEASLRAALGDIVGACSLVQQPPLDGTKIALWVYLQRGVAVETSADHRVATMSHGPYRQVWTVGGQQPGATAYEQTRALFHHLQETVDNFGGTLADNVMRTWLYVQNIDVNYGGMVQARNDAFDGVGLTDATHYIASTGIEGRQGNAAAVVAMDAVSTLGLQGTQVQQLHGYSHLNATHEYGVRFERGTCVHYGDRRHIFISGTASIDAHGAVVYPGDIVRQTHRMWENVEVLLAEADSCFDDVAQMTVYLRDPADYATVKALFDSRFPNTPKVLVWAPVCRPGWLIEMECMAVKHAERADFPAY
jgi:enamine deaminase RidA (YjgF/YER057c/UK114 family)